MANVSPDVIWNQGALDVLYADVAEHVLPILAGETADMARTMAPVRIRRTAVPRWADEGHVGMPGRLKASVQWEMGRDEEGEYADVAALWYGRFLDPPAKQLHHKIPFLPSALELVCNGREFHLG